MTGTNDKDVARTRVPDLVDRFRLNEADYISSTYNETQARTDFITPLLEAMGWDVHNTKGQPIALREVIEEATVEVGDERLSKKPDYELRLARQRKLFVEAKKPNVKIDRDKAPAFQTRRYGYSASLPIAVLTNFRQLAVYDCLTAPRDGDEAHVARLALIDYGEFSDRFDELWNTLSRAVVYSGEFDRRFSIPVTRHGTEQFDAYFLGQVRRWREYLAKDIHANNPALSAAEVTYAVQLFLSRIVFLRICEDREIEKYESLKAIGSGKTFAALTATLKRADAFYDSGLFDLLKDAPLGIRIHDATLQTIIGELYYPQSPYTFAVVETEVLGDIYEQFLGEEISFAPRGIEIVSKPEVRESGGVVPTPRYIVDAIVDRTLGAVLAGKSPAQLSGLTVADICCGSGIFLLAAYEQLLDHYLTWYLSNNRPAHVGTRVYEVAGGAWRLTFEEKRRILLEHIRGVDIDPDAVEVARFSLLLKLIEDETAKDLQDYVTQAKQRALPSLDGAIRSGNSLVGPAEWGAVSGPIPDELVDAVNPFTWATEFPGEMKRGGFDVIVGNPPYIRIQNMTAYSPEEVAFYKDAKSPYATARENNFDKYALFVERSLTLLRAGGRLGVIVPNKFMTIKSGRALRQLITSAKYLSELVHFGVKQVFGPGTANYTCILVLAKAGAANVNIETVRSLEEWRYGKAGARVVVPATELSEKPWQFADEDTRTLLERLRTRYPTRLDDVAEIFVGVQTSADDVYILHPESENKTTVTVKVGEAKRRIEKAVLLPCLHDVQLDAFARPRPNAWMIFPYRLIKGKNKKVQAKLIQPAVMKKRFPKCWAYLEAQKKRLKGRNITGGAGRSQWYQFGRSQSLTKFDTAKLILPILSREPRYTYDDTNIVVTGGGNGPYYMLRPLDGKGVTNYYLLAILNHPLSEAYIRLSTSPFRGGYYSHGKQFIQGLPVPIPDDPKERVAVEKLAAKLITALEKRASARTPHQRTLRDREAATLRQFIEERVSALFGLSPADMEIVRSVPTPEE
jgi:type I restriction-modification system DNA methylase subunit